MRTQQTKAAWTPTTPKAFLKEIGVKCGFARLSIQDTAAAESMQFIYANRRAQAFIIYIHTYILIYIYIYIYPWGCMSMSTSFVRLFFFFVMYLTNVHKLTTVSYLCTYYTKSTDLTSGANVLALI